MRLGYWLISAVLLCGACLARSVTFDSRALVIDGKRQLLVSGSFHYPRSTPAMWPGLLASLKSFGGNIVEMYDFWICHEPVKGQYNFEERYDIVKFIQEAQNAGLYVLLRIGPYVNAEWNYGGLPVWLKFVSNITFRTYNPQYLAAMRTWVTKLVGKLKANHLFYPQGGPIVATQIENEYQFQEHEYGEDGKKYVKWCVELARSFKLDIPWIMCFQDDAPVDIINTCNGFYCENWIAKHKQMFPNQPSWFTENWMGWYQRWGEARPYRPTEDVAYSVLRWYARGGSLMNYYMFFGGNSYGRIGGGPGYVTNYVFGGVVDEFGQQDQPRYGHLQALNKYLAKYSEIILSQEPVMTMLEPTIEVNVYGTVGTSKCVAFLSNNDTVKDHTVSFNGRSFTVPAWSVSILEGCTEQVYNSAKITVPGATYKMTEVNAGTPKLGWVDEPIASAAQAQSFKTPREQILTTRDRTDYLWYSLTYNKVKSKKDCLLEFSNLRDVAHIFVNKKYVGTARDNITISVDKKTHIDIMCMTMGLMNFGSFFETYRRGIQGTVKLCGESITDTTWKHVPGLKGEVKKYYDLKVVASMDWNSDMAAAKNRPLTWYLKKVNIARHEFPFALDMKTMGRGYVWFNGQNVGRYSSIKATGTCEPCNYRGFYYESKCRKGCGEISQRYYHIAPDWVFDGENTIVVFEETGGDIEGVKVVERQLTALWKENIMN